jgi:hypothetical protein
MPTRIVFVGGDHLEVDTPIQNLLWLFEERGEATRFAPALESSMRFFVNTEQVLYLEAVGQEAEKPFWVERPTSVGETDLSGFSGPLGGTAR